MSAPISIEGHLKAEGHRYAIVAGRFNHFIVDRLVEGAIDAIVRHGGDPKDIVIIRAPGCYELPMVAKRVAERGDFNAIIAIGCVIRGATPHFDYVAGECAKGLANVSLGTDVPVAFGVLTCDTIQQAIERAGTKAGNKGWEAAVSAIEMVDLYEQLDMSADDEEGDDSPYLKQAGKDSNPYIADEGEGEDA